jgi:Spy/CpxP family protein refolding chaperone
VRFWKPIFAAVVIFAAGLVTGSLTLDLRRSPTIDPAWSDASAPTQSPGRDGEARPREGLTRDGPPRGGPPREGFGQAGRERHLEELCKRMERDLGLDAAQRDQIESIIRGTHERVQALVDEVRPQTHAEFQRMEQGIKAVLTPEQIVKFDELAEQRRQRFRR